MLRSPLPRPGPECGQVVGRARPTLAPGGSAAGDTPAAISERGQRSSKPLSRRHPRATEPRRLPPRVSRRSCFWFAGRARPCSPSPRRSLPQGFQWRSLFEPWSHGVCSNPPTVPRFLSFLWSGRAIAPNPRESRCMSPDPSSRSDSIEANAHPPSSLPILQSPPHSITSTPSTTTSSSSRSASSRKRPGAGSTTASPTPRRSKRSWPVRGSRTSLPRRSSSSGSPTDGSLDCSYC